MEKLYNVVVNKGEDLDKLDKELAAPSGKKAIPNRPVKVGNPLVGNTRTTQWLLTEEEAEELKNDKRVLDVSVVDNTFLTKFGSGSVQGKMYRGEDLNYKWRANYLDNTNDVPLVNWGLGRHKEFIEPLTTIVNGGSFNDYIPNYASTSAIDQGINQSYGLDRLASYGETYTYDYDGEGVDIVIMDTGIDGDHPEWEGADGSSRLQKIDWVAETGLQIVNDDGSYVTQSVDFYTDPDGHGTSCASLAAGYLNGFAKGAHIYALKIKELDPHGTGYSYFQACSLLKAWHNQKTNNRPTIVNMSFGLSAETYTPHTINYKGEVLNRFTVNDQGEQRIHSNNPTHLALSNAEIAHKTGLKGVSGGYSNETLDPTYTPQRFILPFQDTAQDVAVEELTDAGVHVTIAAGNNGLKIDADRDHTDFKQRSRYFGKDSVGDDFDNFCFAQLMSNFNTLVATHYNRPSSPSHPTSFRVGCLASGKTPYVDSLGMYEDDFDEPFEVTGQTFPPNLHPDTNAFVVKELHPLNMNEVKPEFSAHGNGVDIYAAGEDVMSGASMEALWNDRTTVDGAGNISDTYGLHQPNSWDSMVHSYHTDLSKSHGLSIEHSTSSINDKVRIYVKTTQELLDAVKDRGNDKLESLRLTLHYDRTDSDLVDMVETCAADQLQDNSLTLSNFRNTLISHDYSLTSYSSLNQAQRQLVSEDGVFEIVTKTASSFYRYHADGALYLDTTYSNFTSNISDGFSSDPWDLDDSTNDGRIVFELCFWKADFPAYDDVTKTFNGVPISELFTVGSVIVNKETSRDMADYSVSGSKGCIPYIAGHGYKTYSGTSMAAPSVAGMIALNIEKEGNKTPLEMLDFMSTPFSGYGQKKASSIIASKDGFDENLRVHRISPPESANIGFDKTVLESILYQGDNIQPDEWITPWHSTYMTIDVVNDPNNYPVAGQSLPHNVMVVGSKCMAATAGKRRDYTTTISGNLKFYSGAYEVNSTIELTPSEGLLPFSNTSIASGETWDAVITINGDTYGGDKPLRQDGEWIPKSLSSSLGGTIGDIVSIGDGQFKASLTHDAVITGSGLQTTTVSGTLLRPMQNSVAIGMYPERPSLNNPVDSVDFTEVIPDSLINRHIYTPSVTANTTHYIHIKPELDHEYFWTQSGSIQNRLPLDFENADMPNPLQIKYYAQDNFGQQSDEGLLTITVIDVSDNPPVINGYGNPPSLVLEHEAENTVLFENVSVTDIDHTDADITVKLQLRLEDDTLINSIDHPSQVEAKGFIFDASDLSNISLELIPLDYENMPTGWNPDSYNAYSMSYQLIATDVDGNEAIKYDSIKVRNRTERPVIFDDSIGGQYSAINVTLPENTPVGTVVATIIMKDDSDNSPPHVFLNTTDHNATWHTDDTEYLDVNNEGEVYVAKELDYETNIGGRLEVTVRNRYLEEATKNVILTLSNVADDPPNFVDGVGNTITTDTVSIQEHQSGGTQVYAFETDVASTFTYNVDILSGYLTNDIPEGGEFFRVEDSSGNALSSPATSGVLVVDNKWFPNFEETAIYNIEVIATNEHGSATLTVTPTITDVTIEEFFDITGFGNNGNAYIHEIPSGTASGYTIPINFNADPVLNGASNYQFLLISTSSGGGNDSYGNNYGDSTLNLQGLSYDRTAGTVSLSADADHSVRSEFEFKIFARSAEYGHSIEKTLTIKVNPVFTGYNLLNNFHIIDAQAAPAQNSAFNVVEIPYDIGTSQARKLFIGHNMTATSGYLNDVCIGGVQILDSNGSVQHNLYATGNSSATVWETADINTIPAMGGLNSVPCTVVSATGSTSLPNKWNLRAGTPSSSTGANAGIYGMTHGSPFPVGVGTISQFYTGTKFLYRESSSPASGWNFVKSPTYYMPYQGSIRVAYHAYCGAGYDPLNTLYFGMQ